MKLIISSTRSTQFFLGIFILLLCTSFILFLRGPHLDMCRHILDIFQICHLVFWACSWQCSYDHRTYVKYGLSLHFILNTEDKIFFVSTQSLRIQRTFEKLTVLYIHMQTNLNQDLKIFLLKPK